jgi:hypothetical protein
VKIDVLPDYSIALKEVFYGVLLISDDKEEFGICMRDSGFEFQYFGEWYEAKNGVLKKMESQNPTVTVSNGIALQPPSAARR